jgi:hypothetical protein
MGRMMIMMSTGGEEQHGGSAIPQLKEDIQLLETPFSFSLSLFSCGADDGLMRVQQVLTDGGG